jgi:hypothetical protein
MKYAFGIDWRNWAVGFYCVTGKDFTILKVSILPMCLLVMFDKKPLETEAG